MQKMEGGRRIKAPKHLRQITALKREPKRILPYQPRVNMKTIRCFHSQFSLHLYWLHLEHRGPFDVSPSGTRAKRRCKVAALSASPSRFRLECIVQNPKSSPAEQGAGSV